MRPEDKLKKIKLKRWELSKTVLEIILLSLVSGGGHPLRPTLPLMIESIIKIFKEKKGIDIEEKKIQRIISNLEKEEVVSIEKKGAKVFVKTINNDHPRVIKYSVKALINLKNKRKEWNGKWFMIFFDVPEFQRNKRDYLRKFLRDLGFYPYQKSVYLFPYECKKEVALIKKIVKGEKYIKYIIADEIEDENQVKAFFSLG